MPDAPNHLVRTELHAEIMATLQPAMNRLAWDLVAVIDRRQSGTQLAREDPRVAEARSALAQWPDAHDEWIDLVRDLLAVIDEKRSA